MRNLDFIQSGKVATESPWRFKQSLPFDGENAGSFEDYLNFQENTNNYRQLVFNSKNWKKIVGFLLF